MQKQKELLYAVEMVSEIHPIYDRHTKHQNIIKKNRLFSKGARATTTTHGAHKTIGKSSEI